MIVTEKLRDDMVKTLSEHFETVLAKAKKTMQPGRDLKEAALELMQLILEEKMTGGTRYDSLRAEFEKAAKDHSA